MNKKKRAILRGFASLIATTTNLVQASEFASDILEDKNHFLGPKSMKVVFWVILILLTAQEIEKARYRFEKIMQ